MPEVSLAVAKENFSGNFGKMVLLTPQSAWDMHEP